MSPTLINEAFGPAADDPAGLNSTVCHRTDQYTAVWKLPLYFTTREDALHRSICFLQRFVQTGSRGRTRRFAFQPEFFGNGVGRHLLLFGSAWAAAACSRSLGDSLAAPGFSGIVSRFWASRAGGCPPGIVNPCIRRSRSTSRRPSFSMLRTSRRNNGWPPYPQIQPPRRKPAAYNPGQAPLTPCIPQFIP